MGLFDKLVKKVGNTIESAIIGPMNEEEQKYYDIVLNILLAFHRLRKEQIQKFIEAKYGEKCDVVTLDKVLEKFYIYPDPKTNEPWYQLTTVQSSRADYKNGGASWFQKEEIRDICFAEFREEIRVKFKQIYEVVKDNPTETILHQGISKIIENYTHGFPDNGEDSLLQMARHVIGQELAKLFYAGDSFVQNLVSDRAISQLKSAYESSAFDYVSPLYALVLRAFHFEKADKAVQEYVSITMDECRDAVSSSKYYQDEMKERPFDKDDIFDHATEKIFEAKVLFADESDWMYWIVQDVKKVDTACFMAWEKIAAKYEDTAETVEDAVLMVHAYITEQ